jgi:hypothetical protein
MPKKIILKTLWIWPLLIVVGFLLLSSPSVKADNNSDAIAVRVLPNPNHYGIEQWYQNQGFSGSPQALKVDGYEAIRDGRTVYVNAANIVGGKIYTNIYLISYNQNSTNNTSDILGQIISHWKFNDNIDNTVGKCSIPASSAAASTSCMIDSDCPAQTFCDSLKAKIIRDVKRLDQLGQIDNALYAYKQANGKYPDLTAATYLPGNTISTWPSWQEVFLNDLTLPVIIDPVNALGSCPGYETSTCWNKDTYQFANMVGNKPELPAGSLAFIYSSGDKGNSYNLCAVFETTSLGYDTAEGSLNKNACLVSSPTGSGYVGNASNTAPVLVNSQLNGITGEPFNGYLSAVDAEGDNIYWSAFTPTGKNWVVKFFGHKTNTWYQGNPMLLDSGSVNQKKLSAPMAGWPGVYTGTIVLTDSRGASSTANLTINITQGKPVINADNIDYYPDEATPLSFSYFLQGDSAIMSQYIKYAGASSSDDILKNATITSTPNGKNSLRIDVNSNFFQTLINNTKYSNGASFPYQITVSTINGGTSIKTITINVHITPPFFNAQCAEEARSGANDYKCLLGPINDGKYAYTYSYAMSKPNQFQLEADTANYYLEATTSGLIFNAPAGQAVTLSAVNQFGATTTSTFNIKVNSFCGDGIAQTIIPNTEGRGGAFNNGIEECDGTSQVASPSEVASSSISFQYGCTTNASSSSVYPILDNSQCIFNPIANGQNGDAIGGYCGDGYCQNTLSGVSYEDCHNCSKDCGLCATPATITPTTTPNNQVCVPNCNGKTCGPNGCDGVCGVVPAGYICSNNQLKKCSSTCDTQNNACVYDNCTQTFCPPPTGFYCSGTTVIKCHECAAGVTGAECCPVVQKSCPINECLTSDGKCHPKDRSACI